MTMEIVTQPRLDREAPWIGVGVSGEWTNYRHALEDANMDFYAVGQEAKTLMNYDESNLVAFYETVPGIQVNVREGTNKILGVVSDNYGIVQNEDAFSMLEPFLSAGGVITHAGYTEQGLYFMVLKLRETQILGDTYDVDVMCVNSFNGAYTYHMPEHVP